MSLRRKHWIPKDVEKLIYLVHHYPCLWNVKDKSYKDIHTRDIAVNLIAREMDMPKKEIIVKYRSLRSQYKQYKQRGRSTKWKYFDAMDCIMNEPNSEDVIAVKNECDSYFFHELKADETVIDVDHSCVVSIDSDVEFVATPSTSMVQYPNNKIKEVKFPEKSVTHTNAKEIPQQTRDEHALFGEYIANELRGLTNQKSLQRMLKCSILEAVVRVNRMQC